MWAERFWQMGNRYREWKTKAEITGVVVAGCPNSIFTLCMGWSGEQDMTYYGSALKHTKVSLSSDHPPQHVPFEAMKRIRLGQHAQQDKQTKVCTKNFHTDSLTSHKKHQETLPLTWAEILVFCIKPLTAISSLFRISVNPCRGKQW